MKNEEFETIIEAWIGFTVCLVSVFALNGVISEVDWDALGRMMSDSKPSEIAVPAQLEVEEKP